MKKKRPITNEGPPRPRPEPQKRLGVRPKNYFDAPSPSMKDRLSPYRVLVRPALTVWVWIMPVLSVTRDAIMPFYISTVLSILLSLAIWKADTVRAWAEKYVAPFLYPKKKPDKLYDLAVQIFHFSLYIGMALAIPIGIAVAVKLLFI